MEEYRGGGQNLPRKEDEEDSVIVTTRKTYTSVEG
jgi:hypothetical protein